MTLIGVDANFQLTLNFFHLTLNFEQLDIAAKSLNYINILSIEKLGCSQLLWRDLKHALLWLKSVRTFSVRIPE